MIDIRDVAMRTIMQKGQKYVLVPADAQGNVDALEFAQVTIACGIIRDRVAAGYSQAELARRAGIQPAVLNRIEKAKVVPDESTLKKIDAALR